MAMADPDVALAHWRAVREWLYREHPQSPVPVAQRAAFEARHFEHDRRLRFEVAVEPAPPPAPGALAPELPNSGADRLSFSRIGTVTLPLPDGPRPLCALYAREAVLPVARANLASGRLALQALLGAVETSWLEGPDLVS